MSIQHDSMIYYVNHLIPLRWYTVQH